MAKKSVSKSRDNRQSVARDERDDDFQAQIIENARLRPDPGAPMTDEDWDRLRGLRD